MTSTEFIKQKLNELVNIFSTIKCAYEFDNFDNTHIVEVLPSVFYKNSESFYQASETINNEFIEKFPFEGLFFIDDTDLMPISNVMYEVKGRDYEVNLTYSSAPPQAICIPTFNNIPDFLISQAPTIHYLLNDSNNSQAKILEYKNTFNLTPLLGKKSMEKTYYVTMAMAA